MPFYHIAGEKMCLVSQFYYILGETHSTLGSNTNLFGTVWCCEEEVVHLHQEHSPSPQVSAEESPRLNDPQADFWSQRCLVVLTVWGEGLNTEQR